MNSKYDESGHTLTFFFTGSLDTLHCRPLEGAIQNAMDAHLAKKTSPLPKPLQVVFDVKDVTFLCSFFFRICLSTAKKTRKGNFRITNASPVTTQLLKIAGMDMFIAAI
ncbi:MAG: STAS domain-containing protein [Kiritimatiellae bacterium]|nr:STAS domain-containing protein [Kiritimatiellia bacterium]